MYIDRIWPFTTFISRNKHNKNIRLRLYWLRLRVAEAEVQTSHHWRIQRGTIGMLYFVFSCSFLAFCVQNNRLALPQWRLTPPLPLPGLGNSGSTTEG